MSEGPSPAEITVYPTTELAALPGLLQSVASVVNKSFARHPDHFVIPRFERDEELVEELGPGAYTAVMQENGTVIATASIRKWQPQQGGKVARIFRETRPQDIGILDQGLSYEVKVVVTVQGPDFSGRGLATRCVEALVDRLFSEHDSAVGILLWIQTKENENGVYWRKRGYENVGAIEVKPKGFWNSPNGFRFSTLVKRVSREHR